MQQLLSPENAQGGIVYLMGPGSGGSLCPPGPGNQGMMKMPQQQQQQHGMMPDGQIHSNWLSQVGPGPPMYSTPPPFMMMMGGPDGMVEPGGQMGKVLV